MTGHAPGQDMSELEGRIRDALERGEDIQELVRQLTVRRMSEVVQDLGSLRMIAGAVIRGARAGVKKDLDQSKAQSDLARHRLGQAIAGLDTAMAQFALASKLALEEAASRAKHMSSEDISKIREDLESLDMMFFESLQDSAIHDSTGAILKDLASHLQVQGSALSAQVQETLATLSHHAGSTGQAQAKVGLHLAQGGFTLLRQLTAGALSGLAEQIQPKR